MFGSRRGRERGSRSCGLGKQIEFLLVHFGHCGRSGSLYHFCRLRRGKPFENLVAGASLSLASKIVGDLGAGHRTRSLGGSRTRPPDYLQEVAFQVLSGGIHADAVLSDVLPKYREDSLKGFTRQRRRGDAQRIRRGQQLLKSALRLNFATIVNHNAITDILHIRQQVAAQNDRLATSGQSNDEVLDLATANRIQAGGGLIQNY